MDILRPPPPSRHARRLEAGEAQSDRDDFTLVLSMLAEIREKLDVLLSYFEDDDEEEEEDDTADA